MKGIYDTKRCVMTCLLSPELLSLLLNDSKKNSQSAITMQQSPTECNKKMRGKNSLIPSSKGGQDLIVSYIYSVI